MGFTTTTNNMGLNLPNVSQEPGPQWATDINQAFTQVDQHNHAPGNGVPINSNGLAITQDLSMGAANLINTRSVRFSSISATSGTDLNAIYVQSNQLFFNDANGNPIVIAASTTVASSNRATSGFFNTLSTSALFVGNFNSQVLSSSAGTYVLKQPANNGNDNVFQIGDGVNNGRALLSFIPSPGSAAKIQVPVGNGLTVVGSGLNVMATFNDNGSFTTVGTITAPAISTTAVISQTYAYGTPSNVIIDSSGNIFPNAGSFSISQSGSTLNYNGNPFINSSWQLMATSGIFSSVSTTGITTPNTAQSLNFVTGGSITAQLTNVGGLSASCGIYGTGRANFPFQREASAGFVGEYASSAFAFVNSSGSNVWFDYTNIVLTSGDWDITFVVTETPNGPTTVNQLDIGISSTSGNTTSGMTEGDNWIEIAPSSGTHTSLNVPNWRRSISAQTTIYGKINPIYSGGVPQVTGRLSARRMR